MVHMGPHDLVIIEVLLHVRTHVPMVLGVDIAVKGPHAIKGGRGKPRWLG